ncbi:MAG: hypothetical protein HGA90_00240 [Alphaproteobacteria bacterium]|nr:hypothetical protein [Alphaproteobacteria bacterium]
MKTIAVVIFDMKHNNPNIQFSKARFDAARHPLNNFRNRRLALCGNVGVSPDIQIAFDFFRKVESFGIIINGDWHCLS